MTTPIQPVRGTVASRLYVFVDGEWVPWDGAGGGGGGGAVTIANGADVTQGSTTDAKVTGDNAGTASAKLRGLSYLLALVTDTVNGWLTVRIGDWVSTVYASVRMAGFRNAVWTASHVPAANTQATATRASAGIGVKNVCTGFTVSLASTGSAPSAVQLVVNLIDGASGGGTYLWRAAIALPAVAGAMAAIVRSDIYIPGTANTAMTLEFSAQGGANTIQSVTMEGTTE